MRRRLDRVGGVVPEHLLTYDPAGGLSWVEWRRAVLDFAKGHRRELTPLRALGIIRAERAKHQALVSDAPYRREIDS